MFLSQQSIDESIQSGKNIQQALTEVVHSLATEKYVIFLHAPYEMAYEGQNSSPIIAKGFRYGTIQQVALASDSQEDLQQIADMCGNYLVHIEQTSLALWRNTNNLLLFPDVTVSERCVLTAMYEGHATNKIADILSLAPKTIRIYRSSMYKKFQVDPSESALVRSATEMGYFLYLSK